MDSDLFIDVLGPLWSSNGAKTWSLFLAPDRIIAWPYTFAESLQLALRLQLKHWPRDPGADLRGQVGEGLREVDLPRGREVRRYQVHLLRSLVIQSNSTANTITVEKLSSESDEYAIALRQETDLYRAVLADLYPDKYRENDFPTTAIGRLLRK